MANKCVPITEALGNIIVGSLMANPLLAPLPDKVTIAGQEYAWKAGMESGLKDFFAKSAKQAGGKPEICLIGSAEQGSCLHGPEGKQKPKECCKFTKKPTLSIENFPKGNSKISVGAPPAAVYKLEIEFSTRGEVNLKGCNGTDCESQVAWVDEPSLDVHVKFTGPGIDFDATPSEKIKESVVLHCSLKPPE